MSMLSHVQSQPRVVAWAGVWRFVLGIILSVFGGVMMLLSFPPYGLWPLAWVAFIPALFAQYRLFPQRISSLALSLFFLSWMGPFFARYFEDLFGPFFTFLGVLIAVPVLFICVERKFHELTGFRWFALYGAFLWVGNDMVRATFVPDIGIGVFIGLTQATQAWLIQPVAIFSIYAFNFLIVLVNYTLAFRLLAWYDRKYPSLRLSSGQAASAGVDERLSKRWLTIVGVTLVAWVGLSLIMLVSSPKDTQTVRVASLRPGYSLPAIADEEHTDQDRFDLFASQAREAAAQGAQVLVTSEILFGFDPQQQHTEEFKALAHETNTYIFIGYAVVDEVNQTYRNETVLLSPSGEFSEMYDKNHPMPSEPLSPTRAYPVFDTVFGKMSAMICHDVDYMDVSRKEAARGAQLIALGLWTYRGAAEQQWTYATFNAVQGHTAIVATDTAYFSAVIDPNGRQVALDVSREGSPLVMVADVPMGAGRTIYSSIGDVAGWIALVGFNFFITFMIVVRIRAGKAARASRSSTSS